MTGSCRFAFAVHLLTMLAANPQRGLTSQEIARSVNTNPVVIRRLLAALRRAGLIATRHGAGAGSRLSRSAGKIRLDAVYRAVESGEVFSFPPHLPNKRCPIGKEMQTVLESVFRSAQVAMEKELACRSVADLVKTVDVDRGARKRPLPRRQGKAV